MDGHCWFKVLCIWMHNLWAFSLSLLLARNTSLLWRCNRMLRLLRTPSMAFLGWMSCVKVYSLTCGSAQHILICSLERLINCSFTLHDGGAQRLLPSLLTRPRWEKNGSLFTRSLRSRFHITGAMRFPHPFLLGGISFGTNLRHKKRRPFFGRLSTWQWRWMNGVGEFRRRLAKVVLVVACN